MRLGSLLSLFYPVRPARESRRKRKRKITRRINFKIKTMKIKNL